MKKVSNKQHAISVAKRKAARALKFKNKKKTAPSLRNHAMKAILDNMVEVSMTYLERGVNYFYKDNGGLEKVKDFVDTMGEGTCFSVGVRGLLVKGDLQVSEPLTWVPRAPMPLVKDYLTELWNKTAKGYTIQINSFSFFLVNDENSESNEDEDFDEAADDELVQETTLTDEIISEESSVSADEVISEESSVSEQTETLEDMKETFEKLMREAFGDNYQEKLDALKARQDPFLAACVIMAGENVSKLNGYLILRKAEYVEGQGICLEGENIYLSLEDVLDIHVPPMILNDVLKVIKENSNASVETNPDTDDTHSNSSDSVADNSSDLKETTDHVKV
jgi:hypothetical protein